MCNLIFNMFEVVKYAWQVRQSVIDGPEYAELAFYIDKFEERLLTTMLYLLALAGAITSYVRSRLMIIFDDQITPQVAY